MLIGHRKRCIIRYDTIDEFNVDSKAKYSALSSTRSQKKETKTNKHQCPFNTVQVKIREGSPEGMSDYGGKDSRKDARPC